MNIQGSAGVRLVCGLIVLIIGLMVLFGAIKPEDYKLAIGLGFLVAGIGIAV